MVEYISSSIHGFNLCVKTEQAAATTIVKDMTDLTLEGRKISKVKPKWVFGFDEWLNNVPIYPRYYPVDGNKETMPNEETEMVDVDDSDKSEVKTEVVDNEYFVNNEDDVHNEDNEVEDSDAENLDGNLKGKGGEDQDDEFSWSDEDLQYPKFKSADALYVVDSVRQNESQDQPTNNTVQTEKQEQPSKSTVKTQQDHMTRNISNTDHMTSNISNKFDSDVGVFDIFGGNFKVQLAMNTNLAISDPFRNARTKLTHCIVMYGNLKKAWTSKASFLCTSFTHWPGR
jgi:hypothetical protein